MTQDKSLKLYEQSKAEVGYLPRLKATVETYKTLGFKCGLEVHQQLKTDKKLFCRCPAGIYQEGEDYDSEIVRHMRPTLSELGEYDGTALMEFRTKKHIIYRIKNETACTYDIDDTPPFAMNREALLQSLEIALILKTKIVGELHIARKQYLDGSIPTGFQRTGIVGIEGEIPISNKTVRIIQISIEEDSCREVSDKGHWRTYSTDRLGMPLIESVTYPDMLTPDEAAEAGQYLRFLARSSGKVRTGSGAARQDVNVSITGGTRVEIKGVSQIRLIPELTHNEAFRQKALLSIRAQLRERINDTKGWQLSHRKVDSQMLAEMPIMNIEDRMEAVVVNLPGFADLLSHFTQPGQTFADELSGRLKVIACLEKPNMLHSDQALPGLFETFGHNNQNSAQLIVWGPPVDIPTAIETIEERCRFAFEGVPNETRKALPDGTTIFERVLPGPDRMYPDTDSVPISIDEEMIEKCRQSLPIPVDRQARQLKEWDAPVDTYVYLFRHNLVPLVEELSKRLHLSPKFLACLFAHTIKNNENSQLDGKRVEFHSLKRLCEYMTANSIRPELLKELIPSLIVDPSAQPEELLQHANFKRRPKDEIFKLIPVLIAKAGKLIGEPLDASKTLDWIMGQLRANALGNLPMSELRDYVIKALDDV